MSQSLTGWEDHRASILRQLLALGDFRPGSITTTQGRCGKRPCRCRRPGDPGHGPHWRLTFKQGGKSVSESLSRPAARRKAEREIAAFRRFQELSRELVAVNGEICRLRPVEDEVELSPQEKKRPKRSSKRSPRK